MCLCVCVCVCVGGGGGGAGGERKDSYECGWKCLSEILN